MLEPVSFAITKGATAAGAFARSFLPTSNARSAIKIFLESVGVSKGSRVLLPGYIGWSAREGSGVFDPIEELGAIPMFYRIDQSLHVVADSFAEQIALKPSAVLLIHYFGMPDPHYPELVRIAKEASIPVLEDEAHAMYTDLIGGVTGRLGDAAVYSLHKMLPLPGGGVLVRPGLDQSSASGSGLQLPFDLFGIATARRRNAELADGLIRAIGSEYVEPLWASIPSGVIPQTLPVVVHSVNRDQLYEDFNRAGFGGTSLYHTMIKALTPSDHPHAHWLARRIFNLPIHQDVSLPAVEAMIECLKSLVSR